MKVILPLFFFLLFMNTSALAAAISMNADKALTEEVHLSQKGKSKAKIWQKKLVKWVKGKDKKQRKDKFGRIGLIFLFGGLLSLFLTDVLFLFALLAAVVFGVIGLVNDERKTAAIFALALPAAVILLTLILVGSAWGQ